MPAMAPTTAIPGRRFFLGKDACFDLPFRRSLVHNASPNSPSYLLGRSGSPWHLLPVKHGRISLPTPSSKFSAPIWALFPTTARAGRNPPARRPDVGLRDVLAQRPVPAGLRSSPPRPQRQLPHHLWDQSRPLRLPDAGHSDPVDPADFEPRFARSSVASDAASAGVADREISASFEQDKDRH